MRRALGLALGLAFGGACASAPEARSAHARVSTPAEARSQDNEEALALYTAGLKELRRGTFAEARKAFEDVRSRYPYSPHAALAELGEADAYFREARYIEAADAYRTFIRFHPSHPEVAYAAFEAAESQFAQLPQEWWFMPPVAEKDPGILHQTIDAYSEFLRRFPDGRNAVRAQKNCDLCRQKLAEHELYVARFYHRRKLWAGARERALNLLDDYPKLATTPAALWLAGSASLALGQKAAGLQLLDRLVTDYPHAAEAKRARVLQARAARQTPES